MDLHAVLGRICLFISIACLGASYILAGYSWIVFAFLGIGILWFFLKRSSVFWATASPMLACVLLAAIGTVLDLSLPLMVLGCAASLAFWELAAFRQSLPGNRSSPQAVSLERSHLRSLALAVCAGLVLAVTVSQVDLQVPFGLTVLLVLIAVGGLTYGLQSVIRDR